MGARQRAWRSVVARHPAHRGLRSHTPPARDSEGAPCGSVGTPRRPKRVAHERASSMSLLGRFPSVKATGRDRVRRGPEPTTSALPCLGFPHPPSRPWRSVWLSSPPSFVGAPTPPPVPNGITTSPRLADAWGRSWRVIRCTGCCRYSPPSCALAGVLPPRPRRPRRTSTPPHRLRPTPWSGWPSSLTAS